eukprot:TRINITY_DN2736_c0_g1_i1.p1 TRINITY_DN2736_c0_g1~~TRINITY_DN2736_c0_g1_i1.p1  ORF type:complete len:293 (+),score=33.67 TRINITY_DN2736_c0_g1_i1:42-920(+)
MNPLTTTFSPDHTDTSSDTTPTNPFTSQTEQQAKHDYHWVLMLIIAANYAQMDMEDFYLYFLLAETEYGCQVDVAFALLMTINYIAQIIWSPISGLFTDKMAKYANVILYLSALIQLVIELVLFVVPTTVWTVFVLQVLRNLFETQLYNSVWKLFKLRLDKHCVRVGLQCGIISTVGLRAEVIELFVNGGTVLAAFLFIKNGISFFWVKFFFFTASSLYTLSAVFLASRISRGYFTSENKRSIYGDEGIGNYLSNSVKHFWNNIEAKSAFLHAFFVFVAYTIFSSGFPCDTD